MLGVAFSGNKSGFPAVTPIEAPSTRAEGRTCYVQDREQFDQLVLPHLRAAFNLARWILRSREDAEDVTQEALLRAFRFFSGFQGVDARAWLLQIVRNTCYTWMERNRPMNSAVEFDESLHLSPLPSPEAQALASNEREWLIKALERLSPRSREVIVLREFEGCSYKEIAFITAIPIGTVMSTLARARERLQELLTRPDPKENVHDL
jgi:RNA polymerase sigma-70 factor, ECF subfamily